ncbi:hypothetical protein DPSP01_003210 [Paraphaeosphaeria sporulosa]|uniref:Uncharacterized protein n=1 Tax=Paraphaeosphaeria sporulosa TaxID=1460663 RepID=A0A177C3J5_9PLEO|nr:uncharacterized protein CC84DRAFT_1220956 [Paraphaeosphaeria sporulosa]OAG01452.1 hypothetical protein CC84DRAFT_1220956 [Paraphaeosphaeria sporulosa]
MSTLLDVRPPDPEPLPLYSRTDPDTASIRSAAPSYVSDTPTYRSYRTPMSLLPPLSPGQETIGLPAPRVYAPGFAPELRNRAGGSNSDFNITRTVNAKVCSAVARRRTDQARREVEGMLNSLSAVPPPSPSPSMDPSTPRSSSSPSSPDSAAYPVQIAPLSPLEDPDLVGAEAAGRARRSRVYREMCAREDETRGHESRSWDFMVGQMSDWDERRNSWNSFKSNIPSRGKRGRRFGWRS